MDKQNFTKIRLSKPLRFLIALVPIVWIFSRIHLERFEKAFAMTAWWTVPLLVTVVITCMFLQGYRWWLLIRPFSKTLPLSRALSAHFTGLFYSIALPSSAAGNVVRAMSLSKSIDYSISWSSSWISAILGLLSMAILSMYGLLTVHRELLPKGFFESFFSAFGVLFLFFFLSFSKRLTRPIRPLISMIFPKRMSTAFENIREGVYRYRGRMATVAVVFCVTMALQTILTVGSCFVVTGITGRFLFSECLTFLPIIEMLCISLPLAPSGIGVREALLAVMFKQLGLSNEQLAVYVILGFLSISLKLVGGIPLLFRSISPVFSRGKEE